MPDVLFIYGTLHPDRAPAAIAAAVRQLKPFGGGHNRAAIHARLYDLGAYPGIVLSDALGDPAETVAGELFLLPNDPEGSALLACLDDYEDFRPFDLPGSLFLRQRVTATLLDHAAAGTTIACWVYTYNRPVL